MEKLSKQTEQILIERFGKDSIIALATVADGIPYVRSVNAFYFDGAFYVLTYRLSNKMSQINRNPMVAISGKWFTDMEKGKIWDAFPVKKTNSFPEKCGKFLFPGLTMDIMTCRIKTPVFSELL